MKLSRKQAVTLGIDLPKSKRSAAEVRARREQNRTERQVREDAIRKMCKAHKLPEPDFEYRFNEAEDEPEINPKTGKPYQWRFDMLFAGLVAVEQVGGVWVRGHHSRGQDQIDDMRKLNCAQVMGYMVLQFTPQQIESGEAFPMIWKALYGEEKCLP